MEGTDQINFPELGFSGQGISLIKYFETGLTREITGNAPKWIGRLFKTKEI